MTQSARSIGPDSRGGEVLERWADLALGVFGSITPTVGDRDALVDHLSLETARWVNARFGIGLPERAGEQA